MTRYPLNIVCISTVSYYHPNWTNKQQLMSRLSKDHRVYFVEDMVLPHHYFRQDRHLYPIQDVNKNLTIIRPYKIFPWSSRIDYFNRINYYLLAQRLVELIPEPRILWIYEPTAFPILLFLTHEFSLYDCVDDYQSFPNSSNFFELEKDLVQHVNLTVTSSHDLQKKFAEYSNHIHFVPNGADLHEANQLLPEDIESEIKGLKGPKFLFAGAINFKLDMHLVEQHAKDNPNVNFLFVGYKERELPRLANVKQFAPIPNQSLGSLYRLVDFCYIPYQKILSGVNPLKIYEAMSVGKPIYGRVIESLKPISNKIFDCEVVEISEAIEKADRKWNEGLIQFHKTHRMSWNDRLEKIITHIKDATDDRIIL